MTTMTMWRKINNLLAVRFLWRCCRSMNFLLSSFSSHSIFDRVAMVNQHHEIDWQIKFILEARKNGAVNSARGIEMPNTQITVGKAWATSTKHERAGKHAHTLTFSYERTQMTFFLKWCLNKLTHQKHYGIMIIMCMATAIHSSQFVHARSKCASTSIKHDWYTLIWIFMWSIIRVYYLNMTIEKRPTAKVYCCLSRCARKP